MKNKKGMTIIEIIVCILIVSVIMVFILNLLITVKNAGVDNNNSADLVINQALVIKAIEKDMNEYGLTGVEVCNESELSTSTGRRRIVPLDSNGNLPRNLYCLKLTFRTDILGTNNNGYILQYTYDYSGSDTAKVEKNVLGYKRGNNQTIRESSIIMDPNINPGTVTTSCSSSAAANAKCSLKITLPVFDEKGNNYDIIAAYIYTKNELNYTRGSNIGFEIK